jgi:hypothetical protein
MTAQELAEALESIFQDENDRLTNAVRSLQADAVEELLRLINRPRAGLKTDENGRVIVRGSVGAANRAALAQIKGLLRVFVKGARGKPGRFDKAKEDYLKAFKAIEEIQARYFKAQFKDFQLRPLQALTTAARSRTAELLATGLNQEMIVPIYGVLDQALRGASLRELEDLAREELQTTFASSSGGRREEVKSRGRFEGYTNRIVRDTLNNFSGNLTTATAESLGLEWFYYSAGKVEGSRPFCLEREGKYFHREEVESWAGLKWQGKNPQTNENNILALRGGYNCMHSIIPVSKDAIPENRQKPVKPPAESGRPVPEQAQESQAFVMPKTPEEAIKRGKKTLEQAKKILENSEAHKLPQILKEIDDLTSKAEKQKGGFTLKDSNRYLELRKKRQKLDKETNDTQKKIQELFLSKKKSPIENEFTTARKKIISPPEKQKLWFEEFRAFLGPNIKTDDNRKFQTRIVKNQPRAFQSEDGEISYIQIDKDTSKATFMHEFGHAIESKNKELNNLVFSYLGKRTKGESPVSLKNLTGQRYGANEKTRKDEFLDPYMGKDYLPQFGTRPNELLSMFLTYLYDSGKIILMIENDPEYFQFFAGIFAGQ